MRTERRSDRRLRWAIPKHRAFLLPALSFNRALRACSESARSESARFTTIVDRGNDLVSAERSIAVTRNYEHVGSPRWFFGRLDRSVRRVTSTDERGEETAGTTTSSISTRSRARRSITIATSEPSRRPVGLVPLEETDAGCRAPRDNAGSATRVNGI